MDEIICAIDDMVHPMESVWKCTDAKSKQKLLMQYLADLSYLVRKLEKRLGENKLRGNVNGYFVGDTMSIADIKVFWVLLALERMAANIFPLRSFWAQYKRLHTFRKMMLQHESINKFAAKYQSNNHKSPLQAKL